MTSRGGRRHPGDLRRALVRLTPLPAGLGAVITVGSRHIGILPDVCLGAAVIILVIATLARRWRAGPVVFLALVLISCAIARPSSLVVSVLVIMVALYVWTIDATDAGAGRTDGAYWRPHLLPVCLGAVAGLLTVGLATASWSAGAWVVLSAGIVGGVAAFALIELTGARIRHR